MMEQSDLYLEMGSMKEALHFAKEAVALNENNLEFPEEISFFLYMEFWQIRRISCLCKIGRCRSQKRFWTIGTHTSEVIMLIGEYEDAITVFRTNYQNSQRANCIISSILIFTK